MVVVVVYRSVCGLQPRGPLPKAAEAGTEPAPSTCRPALARGASNERRRHRAASQRYRPGWPLPSRPFSGVAAHRIRAIRLVET